MNGLGLDAAAQLALQLNVDSTTANQASAQRSLNFSRLADHSVAVQIAFACNNQAPPRPDRAAVITDDPVVLEIYVCSALWTDRRRCIPGDLAFTCAFEATGNDGTLNTQKTFQFLEDSRMFLCLLRF